MIEDRFADLIRHSYRLPVEEEQPMEDTMLAAGPITSDVPQTGVRLGRAGVTPQQSAKAGGLDKPLIALLDTLAGAMRGATGAAIGLPGDIRSIVDMINQEGAEAVMGKRMFPTSEEVLQSNILPQVVPAGAPNAAERQKTVDIAQDIGEFLPAPGLLDVPKVVKGATKAVQATKGMPVGMSTQMVGEGVSELGFYSAAKEAVNSIQQPKGTGEQFLKQIEKTPGVKPEEIKWTGLDDFLKSKKSVTKVEVQEFLDKNRVEVKEVRLGEQEAYDPSRLKQLEEEYSNLKQHPIDDPNFGEKKYDEMIRLMNIRDRSTTDSLYRSQESAERAAQRAKAKGMPEAAERYFRQAELFNTRAEKLDLEGLGMDAPTKYEKYQLPGGENYREILITLPSKSQFDPEKVDITRNRQSLTQGSYTIKYDNKEVGTFSDDLKVSDNYKGYSDEQIMNHAKSLYEKGSPYSGIKPISTDFKSQHFDQPNILAHLRVNDRVDADGKKVLFVEEVQSDWHQAGRKKGYASATKPYEVFDPKDGRPIATFATEKEAKAYADELGPQVDYAKSEGVPDAPFKTTWHELSMKRAIQLAAEGGYDRVAFTTGKTQAERYDLSKQIDELLVTKNPNGTFNLEATMPNGGGTRTVGEDITADKLDDIVGKDLANSIRKQESKGDVYSADDLRVGGEGMKGFYDQILPKFLDKYAKKWDGKVGKTNIQADGDSVAVQYIDVTPKMKESVLTKGQPLFAIGAGGAAVQQEDNQ